LSNAIKVSCRPSPFKSKKSTGKSGFGGEEDEEESTVKISHCFTNDIPFNDPTLLMLLKKRQRSNAKQKRERTRTSLVLSAEDDDFAFLLPILSLLSLTVRNALKGKFRSCIFRVLNPTLAA
jgi:hypothetical protein